MPYDLSPDFKQTGPAKRRVGRGTIVEISRKYGTLPTMAVLLVAFMGVSSVVGFMLSRDDQMKLWDYRTATREVRVFQVALIDAETGIRGYVLTQKTEYLQPYVSGLSKLETLSPTLLPKLEAYSISLPGMHGEASPVARRLGDLRKAWEQAQDRVANGGPAEAELDLQAMHGKALMDEMRAVISGYLAKRDVGIEAAERRISLEQDALLFINPAGALVAIFALIYAFRLSTQEARGREKATSASVRARQHIEELFGMTDTLQSASDGDDANEVLRATALRLLPGFSGALYVFNNSRDRLDLSTNWGARATDEYFDHIAPASCWALKRGKFQVNGDGEGALRCGHSKPHHVGLKIPMMARGQIYGLLEISHAGDDAEQRLREVQQLATALADAMSLALSSIALRAQLRNQALRDPLTGLYNRRFLEEMLERLGRDAERRQSPLSAIMIDLDHFKRLNDQHGHAAGDAVLRDVGSTIMSMLRATDVACRYGGEEIAILMPDCPLDMAVGRAEQLRVRIAEVAQARERVTVTASFGVAATPETSLRAVDLIPTADAALYAAKQQGRDRVVAAPLRTAATPLGLTVGRLDLVRTPPTLPDGQSQSA